MADYKHKEVSIKEWVISLPENHSVKKEYAKFMKDREDLIEYAKSVIKNQGAETYHHAYAAEKVLVKVGAMKI